MLDSALATVFASNICSQAAILAQHSHPSHTTKKHYHKKSISKYKNMEKMKYIEWG
jgi:hypothetical protein